MIKTATGIIKGKRGIINRTIRYYRASTATISNGQTISLSAASGSNLTIPAGYKLAGFNRVAADTYYYNRSTITNKTSMNSYTYPNSSSLSCSSAATSLPSSFSVRATTGNTNTSVTKYIEYAVTFALFPDD